MKEYEVTRTNTMWSDEIPCQVVPCKIHDIVKKARYTDNEYHYIYYTIHADSLDDAIMMLRKEFDDNDNFQFVIMKSDMDGIEYCIEIYDDWRE